MFEGKSYWERWGTDGILPPAVNLENSPEGPHHKHKEIMKTTGRDGGVRIGD